MPGDAGDESPARGVESSATASSSRSRLSAGCDASERSGARSALIVANARYEDAGLRRLRSPTKDAEELAAVLGDPAIGNFSVDLLVDCREADLRRHVVRFFADRRSTDTLLVHFSCHGVKDEYGDLYFAAQDTELSSLEATALPAEFVRRQMHKSRSRRIVLLLDCCYSGAFARGMQHRGSETIDLRQRFDGRGITVLTASSAMEYAFEGDGLTQIDAAPSVFTSAAVEGLRTGDADRSGDGFISVEELYDYIHDRVTLITPAQTPRTLELRRRGRGGHRIERSATRRTPPRTPPGCTRQSLPGDEARGSRGTGAAAFAGRTSAPRPVPGRALSRRSSPTTAHAFKRLPGAALRIEAPATPPPTGEGAGSTEGSVLVTDDVSTGGELARR